MSKKEVTHPSHLSVLVCIEKTKAWPYHKINSYVFEYTWIVTADPDCIMPHVVWKWFLTFIFLG